MFKLTISLFAILLSTFALADSVRIMNDPHDAFKVRLSLIEKAQEEIQISYFIFGKDESALQMLALLRKKAQEGVRVRLILDQMFNDIPKNVAAHLKEAKVEIRNFNKFNLLKLGKSIRYRLHDKLFIVDHKTLVMGGRNVEDSYYGEAEKNYADRDVYIQGPLAAEAGSYFNQLWDADHLKPFDGKKKKQLEASNILDKQLDDYLQRRDSFNLEDWIAEAIEVENLDFFHDAISERKEHFAGTAKSLYELMDQAKSYIHIDSPYLIITNELQQVFERALARGVKIRILTNSLKSTDGIFPQAGYLGQRKRIASMGIELFEFYGEDSLHSKSLVIDGEIAVIGSFNFDPRSQSLNTETMGVIYDRVLTSKLSESMDESLKLSLKIDEEGRPVGEKRRYPGVKTGKLILTKLIQFLVVPLAKDLL